MTGPKTIIDAVAAGRRAAGAIHQYLSGARDGEAEILAAVRYRTAAGTEPRLDLEPRARAHPPLPVIDAGSFRANQVGFDVDVARAEAGRCFRCDAVYSCSTVHVVSGRGPADGPDRIHPAAATQTPTPLTPGPVSPAGGDR